jgi:hypothetical protein
MQGINDEFRHASANLNLWSFFEGLPTSSGPKSFFVVEKDSAVMNLPGENKHYLDADHRHVCKFEGPDNDNYQILVNCLRKAVEDIDKKCKVHLQFVLEGLVLIINNNTRDFQIS